MRRLAIETAKLAISGGLLWFAFTKIDTAGALVILRSIPLGAAVAAIAVLAFQLLVAAYRLHRLLRLVRTPLGVAAASDAVFVGVFFNQTFLSFIGGDAMRVWRLATYKVPIAGALKAVLFDRVAGFVGLFVMIVLGLPLLFEIVRDPIMRATVLAVVLLGLLGTAAFLLLGRLPESFKRWRLIRIAAEVSALALSIAKQPAQGFNLVGLSILIQATNALAIFVIAFGLGVDVRLLDLLLLVPPVMLLAMLPISIAGWGVREGAMTVALALIGISAEQSIAMSICFGLCMIVTGLPGGLVWLLASGKRRHRPRLVASLDKIE